MTRRRSKDLELSLKDLTRRKLYDALTEYAGIPVLEKIRALLAGTSHELLFVPSDDIVTLEDGQFIMEN
jgi:hypothetical protein